MDARAFRRLATLTATAVTALLALTPSAQAATSLSLTVGSDPVESIAVQISATGSVPDSAEHVYVKQKPGGGTGCGANPEADDGTFVIDSYLSTPGDYSQYNNVTFKTAGTYLVCAWLRRAGDGAILLTDAKTVTVRIPKLVLGVTAAPATVSAGQAFQVTATAQAEATRYVSVFVVADTGRGCPANAAAADDGDAANPFYSRSVLGGPATFSTNVTLQTAGAYLVCGYFQYNNSAEAPQAVASAAVTVLAPPPPCVVPAVVFNEPLAVAKDRLRTASCTPGRVRYVASARYARGTVFRFSPSPGTSLAHGAVVGLYVSSGRPCIVPAIPLSRSLSQVKRRLVASGCTVGRVSHHRSRSVRRGRVIALTKARGRQLAPRTPVGIVVSRGRR